MNNFTKGSRVYVEGRKRTESWNDKQTGGKHYRDLVYADKVDFLESEGNGNGNGNAQPAEAACDDTATTEDVPSRNGRLSDCGVEIVAITSADSSMRR